MVSVCVLLGIAAGVWHWYPQISAFLGMDGKPTASTAKSVSDKAAAVVPGSGSLESPNNPTAPMVKTSAGPIETVRVEVAPRNDILRLTGTLAADERSDVASNTSGIAAEVRVDRGSFVRKNDVMVQIDPTDAKNKLAEGQAMLGELKARLGLDDGDTSNFKPEDEPEVRLAKASADLAKSNLRRSKELIHKKVISTEAFDQTQTEYELALQRYRQALFQIKQAYQTCNTATAKLKILEKAVDDTTIRAPFDGWVAARLVSVGEQITSGPQSTKVVTLVRVNPLRLSLTVSQQDIARIQMGQTVRFHADCFPNRVFEARVKFITPVVSNDTRSMVVEAVVPNDNLELRPGVFATAELELPSQRTAVFAPSSAVQKAEDVARVFVVRDGAIREQVVGLGEVRGDKVEIRTGLSGRELLAAHPDRVHDGDAASP
jgi:RND family efflux transporter MFP subunit